MNSEVRIIKLVTGETVICYVGEPTDLEYTTMVHPLIFNTMYKQTGEVSIVATKWLESESHMHTIQNHNIIISTKASEMITELYISSVEEMIESDLEEADEDDGFAQGDFSNQQEQDEDEVITYH
jgi:hypothetical protein